tara:strand:- start:389 stop:706 length:318 start_codon:yes stop_codon:yes gene_type:complete
MAGPLPIIGAGVSLLAKQFVKRKAKKETKRMADQIVKKNLNESKRRVNVARMIDEKKHGPQDIKGFVKALKDPKSETHKIFNELDTFRRANPGKTKPNPKSPWAK